MTRTDTDVDKPRADRPTPAGVAVAAKEPQAAPRRVKVEGDLFHPHVPEGAVYVGRQGPGLRRSEFANPYKVNTTVRHPGTGADVYIRNAAWAAAMYQYLVGNSPTLRRRIRDELAGRDVACWCRPGQPCHGDVLLYYANRSEEPPS